VRLTAGTVVTGDVVLSPGRVDVDGDRVTGVGPCDDGAVIDLPGSTVVPGFVDMHVHGGGGAAYTSHDPGEVLRAVAFHRRHGTTSTVASLVSASPKVLRRSVDVLSELVRAGDIAGIHLEGPWLSAARCGAHEPSALRPPDPAEIQALLDAARGAIRMVTLAPELDGARQAIAQLRSSGVVVAIGHTDADYDVTRWAVDAGATVATHLFNAMPAVHHRAPGPVAALLEDPRVTVELITDGVHVHPALAAMVLVAAGDTRVALVTDAMVATGMPDGPYVLGAVVVDVHDAVATVAGTSTIAGSTATMDALFRSAVAAAGGPADPDALLRATRLTAANPARALGLTDIGLLEVGRRADLVVLDSALEVSGVLRSGRWDLTPTGI
jgi:N-acetylglucosamine-6-phosphate deacetylase